MLNQPTTPAQILKQIAQIPALERGKLTAYHFKDRPGKTGPYFKLQAHHQGKNQTQHIKAEDVPAVQAAVAGYQQFQTLVEQYVELMVVQTRAQRGRFKKKAPPPSWPRKSKSSS